MGSFSFWILPALPHPNTSTPAVLSLWSSMHILSSLGEFPLIIQKSIFSWELFWSAPSREPYLALLQHTLELVLPHPITRNDCVQCLLVYYLFPLSEMGNGYRHEPYCLGHWDVLIPRIGDSILGLVIAPCCRVLHAEDPWEPCRHSTEMWRN